MTRGSPHPVDSVVDALACARLTRLITRDAILDRVRWPLVRRSAAGQLPGWVGEFIRCPWCVSMWVAAGIVAGRRSRLWRPVALVLALSECAGIAAEHRRWTERRQPRITIEQNVEAAAMPPPWWAAQSTPTRFEPAQ